MSYTNEEYAVLTTLSNAIANGRLPITIDPHEIVRVFARDWNKDR